jgi:hypothetical protein
MGDTLRDLKLPYLDIVENRTLTQRVSDGDATQDELDALANVEQKTVHAISRWLLSSTAAGYVGSQSYGVRITLARLIEDGTWKLPPPSDGPR